MAHFDEKAKPFSHKWLNERMAVDTVKKSSFYRILDTKRY